MRIFSDQRGILSSFTGPYQPRAPRLFEPITNDWINEDDGKAISSEEPYQCYTCKAMHSIKFMWTEILCLACAEKEKKCGQSGSLVADGKSASTKAAYQSENNSGSTILPLAGNGAILPNQNGLSLPLESDGPETRGWVRGVHCWKRMRGNECLQLWQEPNGTWWCGRFDPHGMLQENGEFGPFLNGHALRFPSWQAIDALLFPQREFKVGDVVECLPDEIFIEGVRKYDRENARTQFGAQKTITYLRQSGTPDAMFDSGWFWPIRSLKLIKAVEDK